jgi:hypothetical protein
MANGGTNVFPAEEGTENLRHALTPLCHQATASPTLQSYLPGPPTLLLPIEWAVPSQAACGLEPRTAATLFSLPLFPNSWCCMWGRAARMILLFPVLAQVPRRHKWPSSSLLSHPCNLPCISAISKSWPPCLIPLSLCMCIRERVAPKIEPGCILYLMLLLCLQCTALKLSNTFFLAHGLPGLTCCLHINTCLPVRVTLKCCGLLKLCFLTIMNTRTQSILRKVCWA